MTREEAVAAARRQFGNIALLKEANHEMSGINFIETFMQDVRNRAQSFSGLAAWNNMYSASLGTTDSPNAGAQESAEVIWGERVSGNYFEVMGVKPILGRG